MMRMFIFPFRVAEMIVAEVSPRYWFLLDDDRAGARCFDEEAPERCQIVKRWPSLTWWFVRALRRAAAAVHDVPVSEIVTAGKRSSPGGRRFDFSSRNSSSHRDSLRRSTEFRERLPVPGHKARLAWKTGTESNPLLSRQSVEQSPWHHALTPWIASSAADEGAVNLIQPWRQGENRGRSGFAWLAIRDFRIPAGVRRPACARRVWRHLHSADLSHTNNYTARPPAVRRKRGSTGRSSSRTRLMVLGVKAEVVNVSPRSAIALEPRSGSDSFP